MSDLFAPVVSIATTKRRRFLWAAWWTGAPTVEPFRKPDAFSGGARTRVEALAAAERAAGVSLVELAPKWARAWARVLVGQTPWSEKVGPDEERTASRPGPTDRTGDAPRPSVWAILGVSRRATPEELKRAYRTRALATHPDHGGSAEAFRDVQRAYEEARDRKKRPSRRTR